MAWIISIGARNGSEAPPLEARRPVGFRRAEKINIAMAGQPARS